MERRTRATRNTARYRAIDTSTTSLRGGYCVSSAAVGISMDSSAGVFPGSTTGDCWSFSELMAILSE